MQFLQSTFDGVVARHPLPSGGKNPPSPWDKHDAIYAAAYYLCDSGALKDIRKAIFAYNHADWYVNDVLAQAKKYGDAMVGTGDCKNIQAPNAATALAINVACGQLGLPYVWGGNGPADGDAGFDCSGLTMAAYNAAKICPARRRANTTPDRWCPLGSHCFPETWPSMAHPATSIMWAFTSAQERWCTRRHSVSRSRSARTAGAETTIWGLPVQLTGIYCIRCSTAHG